MPRFLQHRMRFTFAETGQSVAKSYRGRCSLTGKTGNARKKILVRLEEGPRIAGLPEAWLFCADFRNWPNSASPASDWNGTQCKCSARACCAAGKSPRLRACPIWLIACANGPLGSAKFWRWLSDE
jgi:hypothetical protein